MLENHRYGWPDGVPCKAHVVDLRERGNGRLNLWEDRLSADTLQATRRQIELNQVHQSCGLKKWQQFLFDVIMHLKNLPMTCSRFGWCRFVSTVTSALKQSSNAEASPSSNLMTTEVPS